MLKFLSIKLTSCFVFFALIFYAIGVYIAIEMLNKQMISMIEAIYMPCISLLPHCLIYVVCIYSSNPNSKIKEAIYAKIEYYLKEDEKPKFKRYLVNFETLGMLLCKIFGFDKPLCKAYVRYFIAKEIKKIQNLGKKDTRKKSRQVRNLESINSL